VTQLEIMPIACPMNALPAIHGTLWPRVKKTDYGQLEAIELSALTPENTVTTVKRFSTTAKAT
jgi:hypothetical protein